MAPRPETASPPTDNRTARSVLEEYGEKIQQEAHTEAEKHRKFLRGDLSKATYPNYTSSTRKPSDPCDLDHTKHTNVANISENRDPCYGRQAVRFSDTLSAQCTYNSIKDNDNGNNKVGACAPYRRLHICDYNLENIDPDKITSTHNLLPDVLLAAQHEGQILVEKYEEYEKPNRDSKICTALARSFADIGDIIRGKDLFLGNQQEKKRLEVNLKSIFKNIYVHFRDKEAKEHYKEDAPNYYKLREDWWNANRDQVWKAITCNAPEKANYFVYKSDNSSNFSDDNCGHYQDSPFTNLDYVPQYLRWFEEWREEFCRIKKLKLEKVRTRCRGEQNDKYCSRNGCDCEQTINKIGHLRYGNGCTKCLFECNPYINWIDKKKQEFDKQKEKYETEINRNYQKKESASSDINNLYYKSFYDALKSKYPKVTDFLTLLNNEKECKNISEESKINFNNIDSTFHHSEYCKPCPECGVKKDDKGNFIHRGNGKGECDVEDLYEPSPDITPTVIKILSSGEGQKEIENKLNAFCDEPNSNSEKLNEEWKCYYEGTGKEACILTNQTKDNKMDVQNPYNDFFTFWVAHMLKDSIYWRNKLKRCIENNKLKKCKKGCYDDCKCFKKWIKKKNDEWTEIKKHFDKQKDITIFTPYYTLEKVLEIEFFTDISEAYEGLKSVEHMQRIIEENEEITEEGNIQHVDALDVLLKHEKGDAKTCMQTHKETCLAQFDDYEEDEETPRQNPCARYGGSKPIKSVKHVAQYFKSMARKDAIDRGLSKLRGDATKGTYSKKGEGKHLYDTLCNLNIQYSNSEENSKYPCQGKNTGRFNVGTEWKGGDIVNPKYPDAYMPPRREHMCTSNLEHLQTKKSPLDGTAGDSTNGRSMVNDSFLGDVLLSAQMDAYNIKELYKQQNGKSHLNDPNDQDTVCRAVRYSFADLGDIIRGRDMWDKDKGSIDMERHLVSIFKTIKGEHPYIKDNPKYTYDDPDYKQLRSDWWSANRSQVWKAMQCSLKEWKTSTGDCSYSQSFVTPYDDYIPQRLRWMTEWAEWYCKTQNKYYGEMVKQCKACRQKGLSCIEGIADCGTCDKQCKLYGEKIRTWHTQWKKIEKNYEDLYSEAKKYSDSGKVPSGIDGDSKDTDMVKFLAQLHKKNSDITPGVINTPYSTAAGYIHQELSPHMQCKTQTRFCGEDHQEYAFREKPNDHDTACSCKKGDEVCKQVVEKHFSMHKKVQKGKNEIDGCKGKGNGNTWNCSSKVDNSHKGACMPPRRQSLCISNLKFPGETDTEEKLRDAFIKCSAKETHFLWEKYKEIKGDADAELQKGKIPDDFKRIMYYTFGDYRDILFGTDICKNSGNIVEVNENINKLFNNNNSREKESDNSKRIQWWENHGPVIWEGMLCALSFDVDKKMFKDNVRTQLNHEYQYDKLKQNLEEFTSRPQFLRWFTEWGEEFCTERKKKEVQVEKECSQTDNYEGCEKGNNVGRCAKACKVYKEYIDKKKGEYTKQKEKFDTDKNKQKEGYEKYSSKEAPEYLEHECLNGTCSCMDKVQTIDNYWNNPHKTYVTEKLGSKCECPPSPCTIVDAILGIKTSTGYREGCKKKYGNGMYNGWDCRESTFKDGHNGACMPPRRRRLFVHNIKELKSDISQIELRKSFIETAAIETFFAWHEFKKEKEKEKNEKKKDQVYSLLEDEEDTLISEEKLQTQLKKGIIPEDFKRQMFYTFADYRDIFLGKDIGKDTTGISDKVTSILNSGKSLGAPNDQERKDFWNKYAQDIWDGMICALSYDTERKIKDETIRKELNRANSKYQYKSVKFTSKSGPSSDIPLSDFVTIPQYFRWLEEWGEEFCRKKKMKIDIIKVDCRGKNDGKYSSGDGEDCEKIASQDYNIVSYLENHSCAKSCRSYKEWINTKKNEYNKQEKIYNKEIKNFKSNLDNTHKQKFVEAFAEKYKSVDLFLEKLKDGPCCCSNTIEDVINFKNPNVTFGPAKNCAPCPVFGVECKRHNCNNVTVKDCGGKTLITTNNVKNKENSTNEVDMLVSDNNENDFPEDLGLCKGTGIFKGIRKDQWTCDYFCKSDVCVLKKFDNDINNQENIQIRALFKRWIENFLKDYNNIKDKISQCWNNGKGSICIKDCKNKCNCVEKWIDQKTKEWNIVRKRYFNQYKVDDSQQVYEVKIFLQQGLFDKDYKKAQEVVENTNERYKLWGCTGEFVCQTDEEKQKYSDFIANLISKLKEKIETCKEKPEEPQKKCEISPPSEDEAPQSDILPLEFSPPFCNVPSNPCAKSGATNIVGVKVVAEILQGEAQTQMLQRSVDEKIKEKGVKGESVLKGDIKNAKFKKEAKGSGLHNGEICKLQKEHTNAQTIVHYTYDGPCTGKDGYNKMFALENGWNSGSHINKKHPHDVFLPPRREHFCTSNLEHLITGSKGLSDGTLAIHSLLGDVLLSAKFEAEYIKGKYKKEETSEGFKNKATICRAIRYSFADIGDIIKGTDLWDGNKWENYIEKYLVEIFKKIKGKLPGDTKNNYNGDDGILKLRKDWWEANRDQVWEAMQCPSITTTPLVTTNCDKEPTPLDDYIPQRLRWMTEWAEWYCNVQSQEYEKLVKGLEECKSKCKKCKIGDCECDTCKKACEEYLKKIEPWEVQWKQIEHKYKDLYNKASNISSDSDENEKTLLQFLKKLKEQNNGNNIYSTAAGYIHQEAKYIDCKIQTQFCENKNGETSNSGTENKDYAFRSKPYDHEESCKYNTNVATDSPLIPKLISPQDDACEIVKKLIVSNDGNTPIGECHPKNNRNNYPPWKCEASLFEKNLDGACMPPRRQKLCLYYLKELSDDAKEKELRSAFIKTAAAETFLSWQYYKSKNLNDAKLLDSAIIPPQFLRSMMYTFGDYRDICLDTDISAKDAGTDVAKAKDNIGKVFSNGGLSRDTWWDEYSPSIWKGMLCALSHASGNKENVRIQLNSTYINNYMKNVLEEFAKRPPFLRWYIEWSDEFCREQKKKYNELKEKCNTCGISNDTVNREECRIKCVKCKENCKEYKDFIDTWKKQWTKQQNKYGELYKKISEKNGTLSVYEKDIVTYLLKLSTKSGTNEKYSTAGKYISEKGYIQDCEESKQNNFDKNNNDHKDYAFRHYPYWYKDQCDCKEDQTHVVQPPDPTGDQKEDIPPVDEPPKRPEKSEKKTSKKPKSPQKTRPQDYRLTNVLLPSVFPLSVGIAFAALSYFLVKKKPKSSVDLLRVLDIHKGDYGTPTPKSSNRYIPYVSDTYKGKTYIYMEGDTSGDEDKYIWDLSSSDITSSESEYEEMDINDIYVPGSPKYKTLIEVVLEPSKRDTPSNDIQPTNRFTDEEWSELKHDFISQYLPNTEPNTLYFDKPEEKPFITSIHDRDLYTGEQINYNINMVNNHIPMSDKNDTYSGIDLINDSLSREPIDIYDEVLKRKENELFGTKHPKRTSNNSVAKNSNSDPIDNQLNLFHTWLDKHRDMCEQWSNKEDILNKLNEEWNKDNDRGNVPNDNRTLNTDVSIQIDMDHGKPKKEFTNMDTNVDTPTKDNILDDLEIYNEPFYDIYEDDVYYDVNDDNKTSTDHNNVDVSNKVQIEMDVNTKLVKEKYPIADVWDI
ncbi:erythrocyte membrane protein 1, PfEMP1, putative [Plasmodium sp.]|nr:erythrocyte membrane protein 1, PfEMP1, putative [Plasmodium sp.]